MTDDLISRREAHKVIRYYSKLKAGSPITFLHDMLDRIKAVDAVPVRHGRWLPKHHYIAGYEFVSGHICSECGNDALNAEGDDFLTDFCPNCGARMDEERKEE